MLNNVCVFSNNRNVYSHLPCLAAGDGRWCSSGSPRHQNMAPHQQSENKMKTFTRLWHLTCSNDNYYISINNSRSGNRIQHLSQTRIWKKQNKQAQHRAAIYPFRLERQRGIITSMGPLTDQSASIFPQKNELFHKIIIYNSLVG